MRIYVASSWRNEERQQTTVRALRDAGHEVYDFRNPAPGDKGFSWRQCSTQEQLKDPRRFRDEVLSSAIALAGYGLDMNALRTADATVLVLPCGRSAHLELGYAVGAKQRTIALLDDPMGEPELMYLMCSAIAVTIAEVVRMVGTAPPPPTAQDLLWEYAQRRRVVDAEFSNDLEAALKAAGYEPPQAVCFECQPSWNGRATMSPVGPPTCTRCGKTCHGGHWSLRPATTTNFSAK